MTDTTIWKPGLGSLSIDDGDGNDNAANKQFDWSSNLGVLHVWHALMNKSLQSSAK